MASNAVWKPATTTCEKCEEGISCVKCGRPLCTVQKGMCVIEGHYRTEKGAICTNCYEYPGLNHGHQET